MSYRAIIKFKNFILFYLRFTRMRQGQTSSQIPCGYCLILRQNAGQYIKRLCKNSAPLYVSQFNWDLILITVAMWGADTNVSTSRRLCTQLRAQLSYVMFLILVALILGLWFRVILISEITREPKRSKLFNSCHSLEKWRAV